MQIFSIPKIYQYSIPPMSSILNAKIKRSSVDSLLSHRPILFIIDEKNYIGYLDNNPINGLAVALKLSQKNGYGFAGRSGLSWMWGNWMGIIHAGLWKKIWFSPSADDDTGEIRTRPCITLPSLGFYHSPHIFCVFSVHGYICIWSLGIEGLNDVQGENVKGRVCWSFRYAVSASYSGLPSYCRCRMCRFFKGKSVSCVDDGVPIQSTWYLTCQKLSRAINICRLRAHSVLSVQILRQYIQCAISGELLSFSESAISIRLIRIEW